MKWPKLRFFSSFMALVFLVACAQKESRNDFGVLVGLNQDPSERTLSQNLEKDLLAQYKFEKSSWFDEMKTKGFGKKEYKKKNLFLFDQATKANEKTFNKLQALKMKPRKKKPEPLCVDWQLFSIEKI